MIKRYLISILILIALTCNTRAQQETYTVTRAAFSSEKYDEFSPVYYKNGIVFCSNRKSGSLADYSTSQDKGTFKINYIDTTGKVTWKKAKLFSKSLKTRVNDGPASFSRTGDTIYFSRNLKVDGSLGDLSNPGNKLGIFSAVLEEGKWKNIREFRFNSDYYNVTTPFLSSDGSKLFFSSDRPGGYGGSDIYVCQMKNGIWEDPVNLGPIINTTGNEAYPFLNGMGELFFSSDGHGGLGRKDIYVTKQRSNGWYQPVRMEAPINSEFDDFGIFSDPLSREGYFSSGRGRTIDIYHFRSDFFQFLLSDSQKDNQYCLEIKDTGSMRVDTLRFQYVWDFGDESHIHGTTAEHCFPSPGNYSINLDIIDRKTGKFFFRKLTYDIEIFNFEQPFITSPEAAVTGEPIELDGLKSYCPGYSITGYFWDFGDGIKGTGEKVYHKYAKTGEYDIRMGLTLRSETSSDIKNRIISKKIRVFQDEKEKSAFIAESYIGNAGFNDINQIENIKVKNLFSAETDFSKDGLFQVVILSSRSKVSLTSTVFRKLPAKYSVKEIFDAEAGLYRYIVDQQLSLMAAYPAYSEMIAAGFSDAMVRIFVLKEPAEKELFNIKKNYGLLADSYFDTYNRLTTSAYIMLDQVVMLMNKYPGIRLEIGVHTDNQGISANNLALSQLRAQVILEYLINRGISSNRFSAKGYGDSRPVAPNTFATDRRLNRRIDFTII